MFGPQLVGCVQLLCVRGEILPRTLGYLQDVSEIVDFGCVTWPYLPKGTIFINEVNQEAEPLLSGCHMRGEVVIGFDKTNVWWRRLVGSKESEQAKGQYLTVVRPD